MSSMGIRVKSEKMLKTLKRVVDNTKIIKRQFELVARQWNFVVYGPKGSGQTQTIIREGYARQVTYNQSLVCDAPTGDLNQSGNFHGMEGIPMEVFTNGDISEELKGMEIYNIEPLRPIAIEKKIKGAKMDKTKGMILKEYENKNIAIIETPDESYWGVSVLKYLNECDEYFPDFINDSFNRKRFPFDINFINFDHNFNKNGIGGFTLN